MPKQKTTKKTMIARVVIKAGSKKGWARVPDFGLGKGVLGEQEIDFHDERGRGFDSPLFKLALMEHEETMIKQLVEVKWEEKK